MLDAEYLEYIKNYRQLRADSKKLLLHATKCFKNIRGTSRNIIKNENGKTVPDMTNLTKSVQFFNSSLPVYFEMGKSMSKKFYKFANDCKNFGEGTTFNFSLEKNDFSMAHAIELFCEILKYTQERCVVVLSLCQKYNNRELTIETEKLKSNLTNIINVFTEYKKYLEDAFQENGDLGYNLVTLKYPTVPFNFSNANSPKQSASEKTR